MRSSCFSRGPVAVIVVSLAVAMTTAGAQLANASPAATGLGGAFTARAQGYNAVYWNPANLAMPGNPGFSITLLGVDGQAGLKPISLDKIAPYSGKVIPRSVREQWMLDIELNGLQRGESGGGLTEFGLSLGRLAFQASTNVVASSNMSPGAMEALLFGNAGRDSNNTVHTLDVNGSAFDFAAFTTGAVSYAVPLSLIPLPDFSVGVTGKYIYGHALAHGQSFNSVVANTVDISFATIASDTAYLSKGQSSGSGVGLDLGAAWTIPGFRFGVSMQNVVNTFKWDTTKLVLRQAGVVFRSDTVGAGLDKIQYAYSTAQAALRSQVAALKFKPVFAAGMAFDWLPGVTVSADVRQQAGSGIKVGPSGLIAAGAELRMIPFVPLRGGLQVMSGGVGISGGIGLRFLGIESGIAGYLRKRDGATESGGTLNVFSIHP